MRYKVVVIAAAVLILGEILGEIAVHGVEIFSDSFGEEKMHVEVRSFCYVVSRLVIIALSLEVY